MVSLAALSLLHELTAAPAALTISGLVDPTWRLALLAPD